MAIKQIVIKGEIFFYQTRRWNGRYAQHNNHFSNEAWWKKRKHRIVIYFVNIP